ncbi:MAG TPA: lipopolysaccharide heptosyltransferase II [Methylomirabilota bacterium]|nr:lipopolysaccharide heptosyltransferase II [Methylomirabilota bacterium]
MRLPNWLGDTVMALPMLRALGVAAPQAELWCLGPWATTLLESEPGVARRLDLPASGPARRRFHQELRQAGLDLALLTTNSFGTALEAWRTRARWRIGFAGDGRSGLLTHAVPSPVPSPHQVAAYLGLLAPLGLVPPPVPPRLAVAPGRRGQARRLIAELPTGSGPVVGIQLGAAFGPSKLWPADRLAALAGGLAADGTRVVFLGTPAASTLLREVSGYLGQAPASLVGRDEPALLPALLAELTVLVSPDSGPAHVAAAVGVPTVTLFGPTHPGLTAPLGSHATSVWHPPACAPCFQPRCPIDHRCLGAIQVDEVVAAVRAALALAARGPSG